MDKFLSPKTQTVVGFGPGKSRRRKIRVATITPPAPGERVGQYTGLELRRSKRIDRAVRLMILGRDSEGQPYRETMSTVSLSLHGCCYQSWHNSQIGAKVDLRLTEGLMERSPLVRGRVRYVRPPMNHSELFQIGVEFDTPPRQWLCLQEETTWERAPALKRERTPSVPETKPPTAEHLAVAQQELAVAERLTTIDQLIAVLQGPLQRAAENAVEARRAQLEETVKRSVQLDVATQLDETVRKLLSMVNEIRSATKEEVSRQVDARLEELFGRWEDQ